MTDIHFGYNTLRNHGFVPGLQFHELEEYREKSKWVYCPGDFVYDCFQKLDKDGGGSTVQDEDGNFLLTHTPDTLVKADEDSPVHGLVLFPSITSQTKVNVLTWERIRLLSSSELHLPNVLLLHCNPRSNSVSKDRVIVLLGILEVLLRRFAAAPEHAATGFIKDIEQWIKEHPCPLSVRYIQSIQGRWYLNRFISKDVHHTAGEREVGGLLTLAGLLECLLGVITDRLEMMIRDKQLARLSAQPLLSINHSPIDWTQLELSQICTLRAELEAGQSEISLLPEAGPCLTEPCIQVLTVLDKHRGSSLTQVRLQEALKMHQYPISEAALRQHLSQLRTRGLVVRPNGPRGGDAISEAGSSFLHEHRQLIG